MLVSPLYVFWKNSAGNCIVSRREASSHTLPRVINDHVEKITDLDSSVSSQVDDANLKCTMTRPFNMTPAMDKDFIWAIGAGVADVNDAKSNFDQHTEKGTTLALNTNKKNAKKNPNGASISTLSIFAVLATLLVL
jgi:hypothetical protein